jgi:hypothetical protein
MISAGISWVMSVSHSFDEELIPQRDAMLRVGSTADCREGGAAFLEKRPARFTGR